MRGILAAGVFCAIVAFISVNKQTPENVVKNYLEYTFLDNNGEKAYKLLSSDDKRYISKKEFENQIKKNNVLNKNVLKEYEDFFYYEILETRNAGDTVYIDVALTKPNALNVLRDMVGYAMLTAFSTMSEDQQNQAIENKFKSIMMSKDRLTITNEKTFILVREEDQYKIFLDLGKPHKMEKIQAKLSSMEFLAEEQIRLINLEGALQTYKKMASIAPDPDIKKSLEEVEKIIQSTATPGENLVKGYLKFTPKMVKTEPLKLEADKPSRQYLTLRFSVKNVSEGQVIEITDQDLKKINMINNVRDNFGNIIKGVSILPYGHSGSTFTLAPGELKDFMAVCEEPLSQAATTFLWELQLVTSNRGELDSFLVSFKKDQLKQEKLLLARQ